MSIYQENNLFLNQSQQEKISPELEEYGFQEKVFETKSCFLLRDLEIPQFSKSEKISKIVLSELCCLILSESNRLYRWRFKENLCIEYEIPKKSQDLSIFNAPMMIKKLFKEDKMSNSLQISEIFIDHRGFHCILTTLCGTVLYFALREEKIKVLPKLKDYNIRDISFDDTNNEESSKEILLLNSDGKILLYKLDHSNKGPEINEYGPKEIIRVPLGENKKVQNIKAIHLQNYSKISIVVVSTNFSIFIFQGSNSFEILFEKYVNNPELIKKCEILHPYSKYSLLSVCHSKIDQKPHSMLMLNSNYINYFSFPEKLYNLQDSNLFSNPQTLPYYKGENNSDKDFIVRIMPIGLYLSEFHYFLLHEDSLTIISQISEKVETYIALKKSDEFKGLLSSKFRDDIWIYSKNGIKALNIQDEDKNAWKLYLDMKRYQEAYDICLKYNSPSLPLISGIYAQQLLQQDKFIDAAKIFLKSKKNFEEICLYYLKQGKEEGLANILEETIDKLYEDEKTAKQILLALLLELKIFQLNKSEKEFGQILNQKMLIQIRKLSYNLVKEKTKRKKVQINFQENIFKISMKNQFIPFYKVMEGSKNAYNTVKGKEIMK